VGYSDSLWGLTASDGPGNTYNARGAPPPQNDEGTLTPTAPVSSLPFAPEVVIPAIRNMRNAYPLLWGKYGFRDAFNPGQNWYDPDFLGIDQGPMVLMIENYLNSSIWNRTMRSSYVQAGLARAGFVRTTDVPAVEIADAILLRNVPNPFRNETAIEFRLASAARVKLAVYDVTGREVARLVDGVRPAGTHTVTLAGKGLKSGVYYYRLDTGNRSKLEKCVLLR
jgi:Putative glucoamylase/Secretion system C-terminal sorting domain